MNSKLLYVLVANIALAASWPLTAPAQDRREPTAPSAAPRSLAMGPPGNPGCGGPGFGPPPGPPPFMTAGPAVGVHAFGIGLGPPARGMPPGMMPGFGPLSGVDLTDDQIDKLSAQERAHIDKVEPVLLKLHSLEREFHSLLNRSDDAVELKKLANQIAAQKQTLALLECDDMIATAQILTPEQRRKAQLRMERSELIPLGVKPLHEEGKKKAD